jgi:hypothetical protein
LLELAVHDLQVWLDGSEKPAQGGRIAHSSSKNSETVG